MFVNKYTLINNLTGDTSYSINIPMGTNSGMLGQQDVIDRDFIDIEVDKAVNIIFDYEKVKLLPKNGNDLVNNITYKVNFLNGSTFNTNTNWNDIGFIDEDLKFKKNSFTRSFLRLDFYDSDIATNQNLISFITLYPKFSYNDVKINYKTGEIPSAINYKTTFVLGNPLVDRKLNGEGFSLYHFKDEIFPHPLPPKHLYMRATFNNAKTGKSTGLMASNNPSLPIDDLIKSTIGTTNKNNLYTRYILTRDVDGYFYEIDTTYSSNNVSYDPTSKNYTVNLYQISAA